MTTFAQRSFAGGEIAPALYGRCDTAKYATGLRILRNCMVPKHGGAVSRPGTQFIGQVKSANPVRLIPFVFNASQTYVLEFGDLYMRVYKHGVQLTDVTKTICGVTNANPAVVTSAAHGFSNGDEIQISGVVGPIGQYLNGRNFKVASVTTNTFQLQYLSGSSVDSTSFGSYTSGGSASRVFTLATPYASTDLATLKFVQSADVVTLVHPSYAPRELDRTGDTSWSLSTITFAPKPTTPTMTGQGAAIPSGEADVLYQVTAVDDATGEESLPSNIVGWSNASLPTPTQSAYIYWGKVTGCSTYNVYRSVGGSAFGFISIARDVESAPGTILFVDVGLSANSADNPPTASTLFQASNDYPSAVAYFQQRLSFACSNNNPETAWLSRSGKFHNFTTSLNLQDDDAITFRLVGRQVNSIKHLVDVGRMLVLTAAGEWAMNGDNSGTLTPIAINPKQYSYNGSSDIAPVVIDNNVLYVQARGSIIRDLTYDFTIDGYRGNDLTTFSTHLFQGYSISDVTYNQLPNSIVWVARSDGTLLGLTYIKEQQMLAWHRHDFGTDSVENLTSVPEGNEDVLYLVIRRVVKGQVVRYIERMSTRLFSDVIDFSGADASLSYDGRNTETLIRMTLTGGTNWDYNETLTLTCSDAIFSASDVGHQIVLSQTVVNQDLVGTTDGPIRCTITSYTSSTVVSVMPNRTVPESLRGLSTSGWSKSVSQVGGLWHLEGKNVAVFADRYVVASPNNPSYETVTVTNGTVTLDKPYSVIHVGLPVTSDIETLDIDTPGQTSISDKKKIVSKVTCYVQESRGFWVGGKAPDDDTVDPLQDLTETKIRTSDEGYDDPSPLTTDPVEIIIQPEWNSNGRVFIRNVDPIPLTVLEIAPAGLVPIGRG